MIYLNTNRGRSKMIIGNGFKIKRRMFSLGISILYWKCGKTVTFRLHFINLVLFIWISAEKYSKKRKELISELLLTND
jgi:hypothetical protein